MSTGHSGEAKKVVPFHRCVLLLLTTAIIGVGVATYLTYELVTLAEETEELAAARADLRTEIDETQRELERASSTILTLREELDETLEDLEDLEDDYRDERDRNEEFEDQLDDLAGTVGVLDRLSKTDEELLQKYSRVYFLNENYVPSDLDEIPDEYILEGRKDQYFHGDALSFLEDMMEAAEDDDIELFITSAYRSFDEQSQLKGQYTQTYGSGANTFSADQGYSEHQLGTTADLTTPQIGGPYTSFATTEAYEWLEDNAHEYGFVLSYPEGNSFYVFEPWHWRFVGVELAEDLERADAHFYDWEQRKIDEYLVNIFE